MCLGRHGKGPKAVLRGSLATARRIQLLCKSTAWKTLLTIAEDQRPSQASRVQVDPLLVFEPLKNFVLQPPMGLLSSLGEYAFSIFLYCIAHGGCTSEGAGFSMWRGCHGFPRPGRSTRA
jgi:hypothetical protein